MEEHALSADERVALGKAEDAVARRARQLDDAVAAYNDVVAAARRAVERAADGYNEALVGARTLRDAVVSSRTAIRGDADEALQDFIDDWRGASLEDVELPEHELLPHPGTAAVAELGRLPVEPEARYSPAPR